MFMGFWQRARQLMGLCGKVVVGKREKLAGVSLRSMWFRGMKIAVSDGRTDSGFFIHSVKGLFYSSSIPGLRPLPVHHQTSLTHTSFTIAL